MTVIILRDTLKVPDVKMRNNGIPDTEACDCDILYNILNNYKYCSGSLFTYNTIIIVHETKHAQRLKVQL